MPILCVYPVPLSYVGRRWDIPGTPCVPPHMPILCVYPVPLSYVGRRWDIPGTPLCTTTHANPMCLSRPTVLCRGRISQGLPCVPPHMPILCVYPVPLSYAGHRWDIPGTSMCTTTHANPMCLSRPTVLCRT